MVWQMCLRLMPMKSAPTVPVLECFRSPIVILI